MVINVPFELDKETEQKIINALNDRRYRWRTIDGISRDTGVRLSLVALFVDQDTQHVVKSHRNSPENKQLYTTRENWLAQAKWWEKLRAIIVNKLD